MGGSQSHVRDSANISKSHDGLGKGPKGLDKHRESREGLGRSHKGFGDNPRGLSESYIPKELSEIGSTPWTY